MDTTVLMRSSRVERRACSASRSHFLLRSTHIVHTILYVVLFVVGSVSTSFPNNEIKQKDSEDSDALLRNILVSYYNAIEQNKEHTNPIQDQKHEEQLDQKHEEEEEEELLDEIPTSMDPSARDAVIAYVKEHLKTRIWSGLFPENEAQETPDPQPKEERVHDYTNTDPWWEKDPRFYNAEKPQVDGGTEDETKRTINRVFTASGFALSLVVLFVFFFACTYCWCISSPSKMLGSITTILAIVLLLHRLHEFFLVFSMDELQNVGESFIGPWMANIPPPPTAPL